MKEVYDHHTNHYDSEPTWTDICVFMVLLGVVLWSIGEVFTR